MALLFAGVRYEYGQFRVVGNLDPELGSRAEEEGALDDPLDPGPVGRAFVASFAGSSAAMEGVP